MRKTEHGTEEETDMHLYSRAMCVLLSLELCERTNEEKNKIVMVEDCEMK